MSRHVIKTGLFVLTVCSAVVGINVHRDANAGEVPTVTGHANALTCPWTTARSAKRYTSGQLATQVLNQMTLAEKLGVINLAPGRGYENQNTGVPRLCIPILTLQDGPNGLAYGDMGITQLPASLATAATFNTSMAHQYGRVLGHEAREQGIDAVQAPDLDIDRVAQDGRAFEGYGEDPYLISMLGDAEIEGIQSTGVMSEAKHFTAYTQETSRLTLNQVIPARALQEDYMAPFSSAVKTAHVAAIMCSYGSINGVSNCASQQLFNELKTTWGFRGFIRSDLSAVTDPVAAFNSGLDVLKPAQVADLTNDVATGLISMSRINDSVHRVLTAMFKYGFIRHPLTGFIRRHVRQTFGSSVALRDAEQSIVLLQNKHHILPLLKSKTRSIGLIGSAAGTAPENVGGGSAAVKAPFLSIPFGAIKSTYMKHDTVSYEPAVADQETFHLFGPLIGVTGPMTNLAAPDLRPTSTLPSTYATTATSPQSGPGWVSSSVVFTAPTTSTYNVSVLGGGDSWLSMNGSNIISDNGLHSARASTIVLPLVAGQQYTFQFSWYQIFGFANPSVDVQDVGDAIARAAQLAKTSNVAIVFAHDTGSETFDQASLSLPGYQDALITAVANANPHTIVVLNTSEGVLMPWRSKVQGIVEAWYPGEHDGTAIAAALSGKIDPSGRLPITFPAAAGQLSTHLKESFPGSNGTVSFGEGINIGYRYFDAMGLRPAFPFGFGLSYTKFTLGQPTLAHNGDAYDLTVNVSNVGERTGTEVVQGYLAFPRQAKESPEQLKAFTTVALKSGQSKTVHLHLPKSAFETYLGQKWRTVSGSYTISLGTSSRDLPIRFKTAAP